MNINSIGKERENEMADSKTSKYVLLCDGLTIASDYGVRDFLWDLHAFFAVWYCHVLSEIAIIVANCIDLEPWIGLNMSYYA